MSIENEFVTSKQEEKCANAFAGALLVPVDALRSAVASQRKSNGGLDDNDLCDIARQFDVSAEAVIWQMVDSRLADRDSAKRAALAVRLKPRNLDRQDSENPPERPERFKALPREAIEKGLIATDRYAEFMGVSRRVAMKQIEEEIYPRMEHNTDAK